MRVNFLLIILFVFAAVSLGLPGEGQAQVMPLQAVVEQALTLNPQVRAARYRWESAKHQIIQNYTPADPQASYLNSDSPRVWLGGNAGLDNVTVTQALQFPGKGLLQGTEAKRNSEIARLTYMAALRDIRAQAETGYYQLQLDEALIDLFTENVANLERVQKVTQIAYSANQVTQGDYINGQFALEADRETLRQQRVTVANDKTTLNILLNRRPDEPLEVDRRLDLTTFETPLDEIVTRAITSRQEILEAALTEKNQATAVTLAQLEYAPDYTIGLGFDHWLIPSFAPTPGATQDYNFTITFNLPIYFWAKNEDITKARTDLEAAHQDLSSIRTQTAGQVTSLYRQILRSRETALLYRRTLIPLAHQAFEVMLIAYQTGKVDFTTLISTFRQESDSRAAYLQAVNALLAGKVAIEQAAGGQLQ
jgi:outer membrane protein, heavy metal efflux system